MIRAIVMLSFWALLLPIAALVTFPWILVTGDIRPLYKIGMWGARTGVRLAGVRVKMIGAEQLDPSRTYVFMSNHVSNIDPPLLLPRIPGRTSVMAKQELFKTPILGKAMRLASGESAGQRPRTSSGDSWSMHQRAAGCPSSAASCTRAQSSKPRRVRSWRSTCCRFGRRIPGSASR